MKALNKIPNKGLLTAFIILAALHLLLLIPSQQRFEKFIEIDSLEYYYLAVGTLKTGSYQSAEIADNDLVRPPGYPLFIMLSLLLGSLRLLPVLQTVLLLIGAALLYLTGMEVGSKRVGIAAVVLFLLNPNAAFWSLSLMTETLAGFLLVLSIWSAARSWRTQNSAWLFLSGVILSAAALTRPIIFPLAFLMALLLALFELRRTRLLRTSLLKLAMISAGILLLVLPWQLRNLAVHGQFTISKVNESTFQNWMVAKTLAQVEGINRNDAATRIAQSPDPLRRSIQIVQTYPGVFVKEQVRGIARTLLGAEYVSWADKIGGEVLENAGMLAALLDRKNPQEFLSAFLVQLRSPWFWAAIYAMGYNVVLYTLCSAAFWKAWRKERNSLFINLFVLLVAAVAFLIFVPAGAGESRFRAPADPLLGLLAGLAFFKGDHRI
jgi:4-amino-4-deoxy-L-arabinose transferase-like glycosyltransferase